MAVEETPLPLRGPSAAHAHAHAHQFRSAAEQRESATLGMWLFLVTEIMFFGGLFLVYLVYRLQYPGAFTAGSRELDVMLGGMNTAVLIGSSLTMALAVRSAQTDRRRQLAFFLVATMALGAVFLGVKAIEYGHKFEHHLFPGANFAFDDPRFFRPVQIFFSLYFFMTGLHAVHMIIGIVIMGFVAIWSLRGKYSSANYNFVEGLGLYWHFVDIVWIFLFPLLYLIGRHHG